MRALLPNIHRAAERHERIEAIQAWDWFTFIELDGMSLDTVGRKEFTKDRRVLYSSTLENQKLHLRYPELSMQISLERIDIGIRADIGHLVP
jgi:hypothetical protein